MYDVTINIVAYKNYDDIIVAIDSLDKYTSSSIKKKLYVIDNSELNDSDPSKIDFMNKINDYGFVEYIDTKKNLGFGKGHNYNIDKLDSRYHIIMNPDIILTEDSLSVLIDFMSDKRIGMCVPKLVDTEGNMQLVYRRELTVFDLFVRMFCKNMFEKRYKYHTMQNRDYSKPFIVPFAQGSFLFVRTQLYKQIGGFDDRFFMYMEDADLCKRINNESKLVYCPYTSVIHKWEKGSHKNIKLLKIHIQSMISYFNKWGWKLS